MQVRWLIPLGIAAAPVAHFAYAAQYMSVEQAQHNAFPDASSFSVVDAPLGAATRVAIGAPPDWTPKIFQARAGAQTLGWVIVDQVIGKSEMITYAVAVDQAGAVRNVDILDYRESHGGEIRLAGWRKQFVGKSAGDAVELNRDIKNISGATLSCRHVTEGVHRALRLYAAALRPSAAT